jgi:hypothetical protein
MLQKFIGRPNAGQQNVSEQMSRSHTQIVLSIICHSAIGHGARLPKVSILSGH